jgi:hypothetical protein
MGVDEPPPQRQPPDRAQQRELPDRAQQRQIPDRSSQRPLPDRYFSRRERAVVGGCVFALYAIGFSLRGYVLPGIVGGLVAGTFAYVLLREIDDRRRRRMR